MNHDLIYFLHDKLLLRQDYNIYVNKFSQYKFKLIIGLIK